MKSPLLIFVLVLVASLPFVLAAEPVAEFDFFITNDGTVSLQNLRTYLGTPSRAAADSEYQLQLYGEDGTPREQTPLPVYFIMLDPMEPVTGVPVSVEVPYSPDYETVTLSKDEEVLYRDNIRFLCREDGKCQTSENYASCPGDCPSGSADGLCDRKDDQVCDPDCLDGDKDCQPFFLGLVRTLHLISLVGGMMTALLVILTAIQWFVARDALQQQLHRRIKYILLALIILVIVPQIINLVLLVLWPF